MATTGLITLGGTAVGTGANEIPVPSEFIVSYQDVSAKDAGRTQDGTMHKMPIGTAAKLQIKWRGLSTEEAHRVLLKLQGRAGDGAIFVTYLDPFTLTNRAGVAFYAGDRSATLSTGAIRKIGNSMYGVWNDITVSLIEIYVN